jgi:hypothetical protein
MSPNIPTPTKNVPLSNKLIPIALFGLDQKHLNREGQLYLRLLCRLIDKAIDEYALAKESAEQEIKVGNKLEYGFSIINHLENCINALNRVSKAFERARANELLKYLSKESKRDLDHNRISRIRNSMEHIENEIQGKKIVGPLYLSFDNSYNKICINHESIEVADLVLIMETYYRVMNETLYSEAVIDKSVLKICFQVELKSSSID